MCGIRNQVLIILWREQWLTGKEKEESSRILVNSIPSSGCRSHSLFTVIRNSSSCMCPYDSSTLLYVSRTSITGSKNKTSKKDPNANKPCQLKEWPFPQVLSSLAMQELTLHEFANSTSTLHVTSVELGLIGGPTPFIQNRWEFGTD